MCNWLFTAQIYRLNFLSYEFCFINLMLFAYIPMGNNLSSNTSGAFLLIGTLKRSKTRCEHNFGVFSSTCLNYRYVNHWNVIKYCIVRFLILTFLCNVNLLVF